MKTFFDKSAAAANLLLDCSEPEQLNFWAEVFHVSPQTLKSAVRACCDNSIECIFTYLKKQQLIPKQPSRPLQNHRNAYRQTI